MPSLSFHLLFFLFSFSASANSFHDDRHSLLAFKNDITSDPHASMADWTPAVPFCNWTAVKCSRHHIDRVVSINLAGMDLAGSISPALGNLSFLRSLDLSNNALHGHIPTQLGRLFRLGWLMLHNNQLEGNIPSSLGNCTNLTQLALSYNNLTGSIPHELGFLKHLHQLYLGANILTDVEGGIVVGGMCSLLRLASKVDAIRYTLENDEKKNGADIVKQAFSYPLKLIAKNAGVNGSVMDEKE